MLADVALQHLGRFLGAFGGWLPLSTDSRGGGGRAWGTPAPLLDQQLQHGPLARSLVRSLARSATERESTHLDLRNDSTSSPSKILNIYKMLKRRQAIVHGHIA